MDKVEAIIFNLDGTRWSTIESSYKVLTEVNLI